MSQQPDEEDMNLGPALHLPDEDEFLEIIKRAVMESRLYEPYTLLEKRVVHSICLEKKVSSKGEPEEGNKEDFESLNG